MFEKRLKELRLEHNLTQKELANKINSTQASVGFWEQGLRKPKYESIEKLAKVFNVSPDYLLGNTDTKETDKELELSIDKAIDRSVAYNGNPISDNDRSAIKDFLKDYFKQKGK
ncbi:helix-turn-helix domain-containing protein [Streptococcus sp. zg-JUN1979]|uniref:helix-turn-helix domain-containing protein n=1 Tax=Streptococcus sp. zg-JUN1979 TaxID=3391450 RepID=UPI0039A4A6C5